MIDSASEDDTARIAHQAGCRVQTVGRDSFGHGRTRNLAARQAVGDILVFMTQDAMPANQDFLGALILPIREGQATAAYARQVAESGAPAPETFVRRHNYPLARQQKTAADISAMGFQAFFFSSVAAAVSKDAFLDAGGFPENVIVNEDMLFCANLLRAGKTVAYQPDATVVHSHSYSLGQQFRRFFDIGVFFEQAADQLRTSPTAGTGIKFARQQIVDLARTSAWGWIPRTVLESGLKYLGFRLGLSHRFLPRAVKSKCSRHKAFWTHDG